jgi:hypothetical protein
MQGSDLDRLDRPRLLIVRGLGLEEHEHLLVPWANRLLGTELDRESARPLSLEVESGFEGPVDAESRPRFRPLDREGELPREVVLRGQVPGRLLHRQKRRRGASLGAGQGVRRAIAAEGSVGILLCLLVGPGTSLFTYLAPPTREDEAPMLGRLLGQAERPPPDRQCEQPSRGASPLSCPHGLTREVSR